MCAHIGQNRHIYPPSIFRLHFRLVPPPPFAQVDGGGCYREKFFLFFQSRLTRFKFLDIFHEFRFFWFIQYNKLSFWLVTSFARYLLVWFRYIFLDYNFDSVFFAPELYSHQFRLVSALSIIRFNSSTLYLFCLL